MKKYQDHYFKRAKQENYPARSVYKLQEIEKRFRLFRNGQSILDLGAAPGSWSLFAARKVGAQGRVLGVDLQTTETEFPANVEFFHGDAFEPEGPFADRRAELAPFDMVISDMAPKTTGVKFADQARSLELCELARDLLPEVLAPGGHFVVKIFEGPDTKAYTDSLRPLFGKVKGRVQGDVHRGTWLSGRLIVKTQRIPA
jgi:23S rRNA (uridine2552-2'-O)-methyltransferase